MIVLVTSDTPNGTTATTPSRGRPRDEERTAAILEATHAVLHRKGLTDLTVADIATEAGCGLATIYRRWSTKEELVAAAIRDRPLPDFEETGDARTDLYRQLRALGEEVAAMGELLIDFLKGAQSDPTLQAAFSETVLSETRPRFARHLGALLGDDDPNIDLLIDSIAGSMMMRSAVLGTFDADTWTDEVMQLVDAVARRPTT